MQSVYMKAKSLSSENSVLGIYNVGLLHWCKNKLYSENKSKADLKKTVELYNVL